MADTDPDGAVSKDTDAVGGDGDSSATPASMVGAVLIMVAVGVAVWWALWP
jgi:hypothetical protein